MMKTINQVTNHLISIIPEIETVLKDYMLLRKAYREMHHVINVESDGEHWIIIFEHGAAGIAWNDLEDYEIEYISDECDEENLNGLLNAEIRLYDKYQKEIIHLLESYGYEVDIELEDYMEYYNVFDDNVSHRIIISNQIEIDEEPSYIYNHCWIKWQLEKEERQIKYARFVDSNYNFDLM